MIGVLAKVSSSFAFDASAFTLAFAKHEISRYMAKPAQAIVDAVESGTDLLERIHASSVSTLHDFNCCISCNSPELVQPRMILGKIPEKWTSQNAIVGEALSFLRSKIQKRFPCAQRFRIWPDWQK